MDLISGAIKTEHIKTLKEIEKEQIIRVFEKYKFNECPKTLGISRATFYRKLKSFGIVRTVYL